MLTVYVVADSHQAPGSYYVFSGKPHNLVARDHKVIRIVTTDPVIQAYVTVVVPSVKIAVTMPDEVVFRIVREHRWLWSDGPALVKHEA